MLGVFVNSLAIVLGSLLGVFFGKKIPKRVLSSVEFASGLAVLVIGVKMALQYHSVLTLIICLSGGAALGAWFRIEEKIKTLSKRLGRRIPKIKNFSSEGFSVTSVLFCTGSMAIIGSIQAGVEGIYEVLFAKAILDGVIIVGFAALYGISVAFSALSVFCYQGLLVLLSTQLSFLQDPSALGDVVGCGGALLMLIGLKLLGLGNWKIGDFLPAFLLVLLSAFLFH